MHFPLVQESVDDRPDRLGKRELFLQKMTVAFDEYGDPIGRCQKDCARAVSRPERRADIEQECDGLFLRTREIPARSLGPVARGPNGVRHTLLGDEVHRDTKAAKRTGDRHVSIAAAEGAYYGNAGIDHHGRDNALGWEASEVSFLYHSMRSLSAETPWC